MKKGLFIVFEGIDGAGTSTQLHVLAKHIQSLSKYNDVLLTHEPWNSEEIKKKLTEDKDAYSGAEEIAKLYVEDRVSHTKKLVVPNLDQGVFVLCDRYRMSTDSYQTAQGMDEKAVLEMQDKPEIIKADVTFFIDTEPKTALERVRKRGDALEKFENEEFLAKSSEKYKYFANMEKNESMYGKVIVVDGNKSIDEVASKVIEEFNLVYNELRWF